MRLPKGEGATISFLVGAVLIVVGVALLSVPAALILGGAIVCGSSFVKGLVEAAERKRQR